MGCLVILILLALLLGAGMWLTVGLVGLLATLVMAGLVGWVADMLIPGGALPGGWLGAVLTGLIGGFIGHLVFNALGIHDPGFRLLGIDLIPAFVGAVLIALAAQLFTSRRRVV
jgi:uncharacterized membrane protein YeaQ/YmgE (transglycosylase-associated protein family)